MLAAAHEQIVCLCARRMQCCALTKLINEIKNILFVRRLLKANLVPYVHAPPCSASAVVRLQPDTAREDEDKNIEAKRRQQMPREDERSKVKFERNIIFCCAVSKPTHPNIILTL